LSFLPENQTWLIGWFIVACCVFINIRGITAYAVTEMFMAYFKYSMMLILGVISIFMVKKVEPDHIWGGSNIGSDGSSILTMVGFTLFLFVGAEYVTPLAPEMHHPHRDIKRSLFAGLTLSLLAMLVFGTGIVWQVPNVPAPGSEIPMLETPEAAVAFGGAVLGNAGKWAFVLIIFIATAALINTIIASIPRILYGMAKDGMLPAVFAKTHPQFGTPWVGILFIGAIPMLGSLLIGNNLDGVFSLILSAICSWIFLYLLVNFAVILLRNRRPDLHRPYKVPMYPLPQILATVGLLITFFYLTPPFLTPVQIYLPFLAMLGICAAYAFFWIKFKQKMALWKPVEPEELMSGGE
jgi:amino acid transporter